MAGISEEEKEALHDMEREIRGQSPQLADEFERLGRAGIFWPPSSIRLWSDITAFTVAALIAIVGLVIATLVG